MTRTQVGVAGPGAWSRARIGLVGLLLAAGVGSVAVLGAGATMLDALGWMSGVGVGVAAALLLAVRRPVPVSMGTDDATAARALAVAGDGYWDLDLRRGKVRYSERCATMLGYAPDEVEDTLAFWGGLVHPDDLTEARRRLDAHTAGGTDVYDVEVRLRAKDGTWRWVLDRGHVVERDASGEAVRVVGVHRPLPGPPHETPQWLMQRVSTELEALLAVFMGRRELAAEQLGPANPFVDTFDAAVDRALTLADALSAYTDVRGSSGTEVSLREAVERIADAHHLSVDVEGDDAKVIADRRLLETALAAACISLTSADGTTPLLVSIAIRDARAVLRIRAEQTTAPAPERRWRWVVARVVAERHGGFANTHGDPRAPDEIELGFPLADVSGTR